MTYENCRLCPRACGVDRRTQRGFCGQSDVLRVARYQKHLWEEPCISGTRGSGTVFFSGCTKKCVFCQNYEVSRGMGTEITASRLADIFLELQDMGCHNVSLVTATHFVPGVLQALDRACDFLHVPVVFNCGGYERVETLKALEGSVQVWLPDFKYKSAELSARYSAAPDYYDRAMEAIAEMLRQSPRLVLDQDGILQRGVVIRHLVMPGAYRDSIAVLEALAESFGTENYYLSLMSQFTPMPSCKDYPEIDRRITTFEYRKVAQRALDLGFRGYFQDRDASSQAYIPPFGENDVKPE